MFNRKYIFIHAEIFQPVKLGFRGGVNWDDVPPSGVRYFQWLVLNPENYMKNHLRCFSELFRTQKRCFERFACVFFSFFGVMVLFSRIVARSHRNGFQVLDSNKPLKHVMSSW